ncbi:GNAT family N-acetyltransferase [Deinococcus sp. Leaf326]|uniref:GNAT family N-acetyltransferase n=1 Tax=Deinococcus sp. Leaf326 TaxID=1736338 RepID=UPI0009EAB382|nr:GNAT family N-acetyltransferase [Deinococcus sp. Leaf326]
MPMFREAGSERFRGQIVGPARAALAPAPVLLRRASAADAEALAWIIRTAFAEYRDRLSPPSPALQESSARLSALLQGGGGAFLAECGGQVAGCVLYEHRGDHLYLSRLSVLPRTRGRGLARALTSVVERRAAELGLGCVRLSVRRALPRNQAMYLHFGYQHFGTGEAAGCPSAASEMLEKHLRAACRIRQQH